jgi:hypothetical protein
LGGAGKKEEERRESCGAELDLEGEKRSINPTKTK